MNNYKQNRTKLINRMKNNSILLLSSGLAKHKTADYFYSFQVNKNFYYLTGIVEQDCTLVLIKDGEQTSEYLFIDETTDFMRTWVGEKVSKEEASKLSGIHTSKIFYNTGFMSFINRIMTVSYSSLKSGLSHLYLDLLRPRKNEQPIAHTQFKEVISLYKELSIENINREINHLRLIKSNAEVEKLREVIDITNLGLNRIMKELKNRNNEHQIEADFNHEITLNGAEGVGFDTILASGSNATILHYEDNDSPLQKDELLLCDLGALKDEYSADISRTYPISGTFSKRQKEIYQAVLKCNKECIKMIKPGVAFKEIHDMSRKILATECIKLGLIKEENEISKYYVHSIGHNLGLDVHDVGVTGYKLEPGMVLTIEPGLYIKEEGLGIRIEDDILVTEDGYENLSINIIKEVSEIENYMK